MFLRLVQVETSVSTVSLHGSIRKNIPMAAAIRYFRDYTLSAPAVCSARGLGNSTQKIQSIPEAQNDMIFSIICEELGLFGAVLLTILFVFLLYRLMFIAQNAPDLLGSLIVTGIFAHIALQVILNIAVVLNVIPTTGVTLPFISYGGTSILFLMTEMGNRPECLAADPDKKTTDDYFCKGRFLV